MVCIDLADLGWVISWVMSVILLLKLLFLLNLLGSWFCFVFEDEVWNGVSNDSKSGISVASISSSLKVMNAYKNLLGFLKPKLLHNITNIKPKFDRNLNFVALRVNWILGPCINYVDKQGGRRGCQMSMVLHKLK